MKAGYCKLKYCTLPEIADFAQDRVPLDGGVSWEDAAQKAGFCEQDTCTPDEIALFA